MRKANGNFSFTFFLAVVGILLSSFSLPVFGAIPSQERAAIIALYNSTNGDNWTDNSGWKTPPRPARPYAWTVGSYTGGTAAAGTGYTIKIKEIGTAVTDTGDGTITLIN
jgi:hypothetical protein